MTNPRDARVLATAEAQGLLARLVDASRRDRAAFVLGYILAFDAMAPHLPADELQRQLARARVLHALSEREYR